MQKRVDQIPEDVARLAGVRFALAAELTGGHLNESLVKDLTGGDRLAARYLFGRTFQFEPIVKLWLYGNAKPTISETTEGIWRRVRLVPFMVTIPEPERDGNLPDKLRGELPGILAWAIRGCQAWQREGLNPPAAVKIATNAYRDEQDEIGRFIAECCICGDGKFMTAGLAHEAYKRWGGAWSQRRFSQAMTDHGYKTDGRDKDGRAIYRGLGLLDSNFEPTSEAEPWQN
jgi:putative DNA primase/helicase